MRDFWKTATDLWRQLGPFSRVVFVVGVGVLVLTAYVYAFEGGGRV